MNSRPSQAQRTPRKGLKIAALLLSVALIGVVGFKWREHQLVLANVPARPELRGWPSEFVERLDEADTSAKSFFHGQSGLIALSRLYHINGVYNSALSCYDGLRALQPREAKWWHLEATILGDFGRTDDAMPLFRQAIALDPADNPGRIKLGELLLKSGRSNEANAVFSEALQVNHENPYALLGLAQIASARGDWTMAKTVLENALRQQGDFVGALSLLVTVDEKLGDAAAARSLREALGSQEFVDVADPWVFDLYSDCYDAYRLSVGATVQRFAKNYPAAIGLFEHAIQLAPQVSAYQRELGLLLADLERYQEAKPHAVKATQLSPADPYTWTLLVRVLGGLQENDAAWQALSQGLANCPNSQDLHLARGNRLVGNQRYQEAIAEFKETHRLWPSEAAPLVDLAQTYFRLGQNEAALDSLREALECQPGNPAALAILVVYSIQVGDKGAAKAYFQQLQQHAGSVGTIASRLRQGYQNKFGELLP